MDVDHRALEDVGRRALNRQVDRLALGAAANLAVPARQLRHQPPPAEHRLHDAGRARFVERVVDERADRREAGEVGVDEVLRRLLRETPMSLASVNACLSVEQRVVDDLRAAPQLVLAQAARRRRTPSARCDRGCPRRCANASMSASLARQVREDAQLDLRVVGRDQDVTAARRRTRGGSRVRARCGSGCSAGWDRCCSAAPSRRPPG